ncbi:MULTISPECIES: hypothetical protein [Aneurinibacillus]|uniref:Uncharacterized protein n=1 Tax=Aneurinibacillus migulanus TaxID=47500 RepID=A0A0D1Y164_ANEMI|nr:hypothetical protein [Aneurinibacillus migulanus]KIV60266.1 hypothetical protein TS65_00295 [Aneurinibacillus migulanus]KON90535.1 hypothetical protein AF333_29110 [Aneurinibacillus migulanus]MED0894875.1 hypothetical protein [Aneurinibacillus migulanus]MED1614481.1 hypothetical protein [Aneurinibacillus migulanus]SDJ76571.1 hypothetical protein SAMN04487909_1286 [Aneurinibacillus migulanus]
MPFVPKFDWTFDTDVTEYDILRWEHGIYDAHLMLSEHAAAIAALQIDVKSVKDALFNNFTDNIFTENLDTLTDVQVISGWYDEVNKRLVV